MKNKLKERNKKLILIIGIIILFGWFWIIVYPVENKNQEDENLNISMFGFSNDFKFYDNPSSYLTINPEWESNKSWDWKINLMCFNSTDKIDFVIEYENYNLNYTLDGLCKQLHKRVQI